MNINRRKFIGKVAYASIGAGVSVIAGCNDSDRRQPARAVAPEEAFSATGKWQFDEARRELTLLFEQSDFPDDCEPRSQDAYTYRARAVLGDAMYWLVEDEESESRLMQWMREPTAEAGLAGEWINANNYVLGLAENGAMTLNFTGSSCSSYGFAGISRLMRSPFQQSIASGDPQSNSLVLWTREATQSGHILRWEVADDPFFRNLLQTGEVLPNADNDYTIKAIASGLEAGREYYYRFSTVGFRDAQGQNYQSMVGRARTLPTGSLTQLKFGVVSCSSYPHGFFNAYRRVAHHDDLDYVLHLGDYIYEYPGISENDDNDYGDQQAINQGRMYRTDNQVEITALEDYRKRHRHYKEDPDLQLLHTRYAFITTWDDHETTDNSWDPDGSGPDGGAVNHQQTEGAWEDRKAFGVRAYNEWMPISHIADVNDPQIHRHFSFGDLAELMILDTRIQGRHKQPNIFADNYHDPERRLISETQEAWLKERLSKAQQAGRRWKLIGQQVMMGHLQGPPILGAEQPENLPGELVSPEWANVLNSDQWDGYDANRQRIWDHIKGSAPGIDVAVDNVVVLTGDIHTSWAMEMVEDPALAHLDGLLPVQKYGVEFVTPSITSPGLPDPEGALSTAVKTYNPHIKYSNLDRRGYMILEITPQSALATWYHVESILDENNNNQELAARFRVVAGSRDLQREI